jgi:alpha-2-macroglobulin
MTATASSQPQPTGTSAPSQGPTPGSEDTPIQVTPRREFPDTAYWNATLVTEADGTVRVTVRLPDTLTTWRAVVRAVTLATEVGQGTGDVTVTKPISADPALPRFAVQGDRFAVDVLARNYAGGALAATCRLEAPGLVALDPGVRAIDLPFNETRATRWSVVASEVGTNTVSARLDTSAGSDAIEVPLEVMPLSVPERFGASGTVTDVVTTTFSIPFNAVPDASKVELLVTPSEAMGVIDGLEGLIAYPYGCVEQTMSRMLPNASVGRLILVLDIQIPEITAQLDEVMRAGLQKLYGFQLRDGAWGWWGSERNVYITAYVLHGLLLAREAGFSVDPTVVDRGLTVLGTLATAERDARIQAYAAYVLALGGRLPGPLLDAVYRQRSGLDAFAMAALAIAEEAAGRSTAAAAAMDDLEALARVTDTTAYWPLAQGWSTYHWRTMASAEKNTAMALEALVRLRKTSPLAPKAARWLMEQRSGGAWSSTQATAFAVVALADYAVASGERTAAFDWSVAIDGESAASGRVDSTNRRLRIPSIVRRGSDLAPGMHEVVIRVSGDGVMYYSLAGDLALYRDGIPGGTGAGHGITVRREYMSVATGATQDQWDTGDLINVYLTVETSEALSYMIVEDMLPAGLEAVNTGLKSEARGTPRWKWWGYERKEIRDEKVTFFDGDVPLGRQVFEYAARAVTPGVFAARPAVAYAMYRPDVWGRSASDEVRVAPETVKARDLLAGDFDQDCRTTEFDASLVAEQWATDGRRDLDGDRRIDATDIGLSLAHAGARCGAGFPLPPGEGGTAALRIDAPATVAGGETFDVAVRVEGRGPLRAFDLAVALPADNYEVVRASAGDVLADARVLGPQLIPGGFRLGAFAPAAVGMAGDEVLVRLTMRAKIDTAVALDVGSVRLVDDRGGTYRVTFGDRVVSPDPWRPTGVVFLPSVGW